jgi:hypothetical protein
LSPTGPDRAAFEIDTSVAHAARVYDYLLGGTSNFEVDRAAARRQTEAIGGLDNARAQVRANRDFLARSVAYLVGEVGIRQFLDVGTGIPNHDNVHGVAQRIAPEARVVYVDNDPVVLAHARDLLKGSQEGVTAYLAGDLRQPGDILRRAATTLDLSAPVGLMLVGVLHFLLDSDDPYGVVATMLEAVPPGSYLVVSHLASDIQAEAMAELAERANAQVRETAVLRSRDEVARFFDGLDVLDPGVVPVDQWRPPEGATVPSGPDATPIYGAVARKPSP